MNSQKKCLRIFTPQNSDSVLCVGVLARKSTVLFIFAVVLDTHGPVVSMLFEVPKRLTSALQPSTWHVFSY